MPIFPETIDDVTNTNFKVVAGAPAAGSAIAQHLAAIDAVDRQRVLGVIQNSSIMEALGQRSGMDVSEAIATGRVQASSSADLMAQLGTVNTTLMGLAQIVAKLAQTTNPETGK